MPNSQNSTEAIESQIAPATNGNHINSATQNYGPIDTNIKMNPAKLRRLEESSKASSSITSSTRTEPTNSSTSIASSATLYAPSVSGTTLNGTESEPRPRTFKTGHGVCCNPDLMKRCLEHGEVEEGREGERLGESARSSGVGANEEVIDAQISGYTGPTDTEPKTEEEREAGRERIKARLERIQ